MQPTVMKERVRKRARRERNKRERREREMSGTSLFTLGASMDMVVPGLQAYSTAVKEWSFNHMSGNTEGSEATT